MRLIAHRGNYKGSNKEKENEPSYIIESINAGFDAEIDVWHQDGLYLGHDKPQHEIDIEFLLRYHNKLWIHCKNLDALDILSENIHLNVFWHDKDSYTLTSQGFIWTYPHNKICDKSVIVCNSAKFSKYQDCYGVCSDYLL
jgi:hypothetical protein